MLWSSPPKQIPYLPKSLAGVIPARGTECPISGSFSCQPLALSRKRRPHPPSISTHSSQTSTPVVPFFSCSSLSSAHCPFFSQSYEALTSSFYPLPFPSPRSLDDERYITILLSISHVLDS